MSLVIYNSLSRKKEEFKPLNPGEVKMYVCGPTVYDLLHVGNFRGPTFFNLVRNWLEHLGYRVKFVFNYTDVDDKIIARAKAEGVTEADIASKYIAEFRADFDRLGLRPHDVNPKITETMPEILGMIGELIGREKAYPTQGDVNYSIKANPEYGKLSGRNTEDMLTGVRIDPSEKKRDPLDFALWKGAKAGEPAWESPWGSGRPGWHIECSAMIKKHLGDTIDIHGGGMDLIFPHHENEIAQSEGATGKPFVRYWMHNNMINFGGAKMSKSLGNVRTLRSFIDQFSPEVFKYMILSSHYRSISDLSPDAIDNAIAGLARIYSALALADTLIPSQIGVDEVPVAFQANHQEAWARIEKSMNDDFNTPEAMAVLFEQVRSFNAVAKRGMKPLPQVIGQAQALRAIVARLGTMMSLFRQPAAQFMKELDDLLLVKKNLNRGEIEKLVAARSEARAAKNFPESDRLRQQLTEMGISVQDLPTGSYWEVTK